MTRYVLPIVVAVLVPRRPATAQSVLDSFMTEPAGRIGLNYQGAFNVRASFKHLGNFPAASNPGPATGGGIDRFYDDGFNRVDASGNAGGLTTYWSYQSPSQVPGNDTVVMHSSSVSSAHNSGAITDDPQHGFELTYAWPLSTGKTWRWGLAAAFGFTDLSIKQNENYAGNLVRLSDAFTLGGITPPIAPYTGTFSGPGPLLGDTPGRTITTIANAVSVASQEQLNGQFYQLRLGPYLEIPLTQHAAICLGGGLAGAVVHTAFEFNETGSLAGSGTFSASGRNWNSDGAVGGYASAQFLWALSRHVALTAGGQYQSTGRFNQSIDGREAELDLRNVIFVSAGLGYAF